MGGAPQTVLATMHSVFLARALYVVADLGIADLLADGPRGSDELAEELGVTPTPLRQVLRGGRRRTAADRGRPAILVDRQRKDSAARAPDGHP